ncbi:MAG TPA: hypothetical protein VGL99_19585 [Chloroflexota bacterium]|jgi:hypothetical protein
MMFNFFNKSQPRYPTIRQALVQSGLSAAVDSNKVAVVEKHGQYSGRRVSFFRAFAPGHQDVLLGSGHVEHEGAVVVYGRPGPEGAVPARQPANRASHADDERLVFWDPARARSSEATLSAPAATWLHARSTSAPGVSP